MKLLKGFALAINMLTILPFFKVHEFFKGINGYSAMFYPLVGFLLGSFLWLTHTLLEPYLPATHLAVLIFTLWVIATGALHLDGFSDTVDGLFVNKEKALEIMKDPHIGGMGMIFSVLFLALKLSSVLHFKAFYLLPVILMFSRLNALFAIYIFDYISTGITTLIKEELTIKHIFFALVYSLIFGYLFSFLSAFLVALCVLIIVSRLFIARLGGFNGDLYGFLIEITELALLNYIILRNFS